MIAAPLLAGRPMLLTATLHTPTRFIRAPPLIKVHFPGVMTRSLAFRVKGSPAHLRSVFVLTTRPVVDVPVTEMTGAGAIEGAPWPSGLEAVTTTE